MAMKLSAYIAQRRGMASALARKLGVKHSTVIRWAAGVHYPSLPMCVAIEKATDGAVRAQDFVPSEAA